MEEEWGTITSSLWDLLDAEEKAKNKTKFSRRVDDLLFHSLLPNITHLINYTYEADIHPGEGEDDKIRSRYYTHSKCSTSSSSAAAAAPGTEAADDDDGECVRVRNDKIIKVAPKYV